jgi:hypothetical protein
MTILKIWVPVFVLTLKIDSLIKFNKRNNLSLHKSFNCIREVDSELVASNFNLAGSAGSNNLMISARIRNNTLQVISTDLYVIFIGPDKNLIPIAGFASGNLLTKRDGNIKYSARLPFEIQAATATKITISLPSTGKPYQPGIYEMDIYAKGEKIGSGYFHI